MVTKDRAGGGWWFTGRRPVQTETRFSVISNFEARGRTTDQRTNKPLSKDRIRPTLWVNDCETLLLQLTKGMWLKCYRTFCHHKYIRCLFHSQCSISVGLGYWDIGLTTLHHRCETHHCHQYCYNPLVTHSVTELTNDHSFFAGCCMFPWIDRAHTFSQNIHLHVNTDSTRTHQPLVKMNISI